MRVSTQKQPADLKILAPTRFALFVIELQMRSGALQNWQAKIIEVVENWESQDCEHTQKKLISDALLKVWKSVFDTSKNI